MAELTGKPFHVSAWIGLLAPAGTDPVIVAMLNAEIRKALKADVTREALVSNGADPVGNSPAEFQAFITNEMKTWGEIIKKANITPS